MTDVKCIRCGALTIDTTRICKICEIELNPIRPSSAAPVFIPYQPRAVPDDSGTTIGPFNDVGDVLKPTIVLFTKHFWLITKITVVIVAPFELFRSYHFADIPYDWELSFGVYILDLLCSILTGPALIYALMQVMQTGVAPGINESYRWGAGKIPKLAIAAAISWVLIALGMMLCLVPGIAIALSLSLVFPIAVLEKGSPFAVFNSSSRLTKGHRWKILGATIVVMLLTALFTIPAEMGGEYLVAGNLGFWPLQAIAAIFSDIMQQSTVVLSLVLYLSIRAFWSQSTQ